MKKITLVTGASSGLGKEISRLLCKKGHFVYVTARQKDKLIKLQEECLVYKGKIKIIDGNLSHTKFRKKLISQILKEQGKIDYLINNAGFGRVISFERQSAEEIQKMFDLNIVAYIHLTNLVLKDMLKRNNGRIIHIGSVASFIPRPYYAVYNSTKAAVYTFNRSLRYELKGKKITSTLVLCARIKTNFANNAYNCYEKNVMQKCVRSFNKVAEDPQVVAKKIIEKLDTNKEIIIPNFRSFVSYFARYFPDITDLFLKLFLHQKKKFFPKK